MLTFLIKSDTVDINYYFCNKMNMKVGLLVILISFLVACNNGNKDKNVIPLNKMSLEKLDSLSNRFPDSVNILKVYGTRLLEDLRGDEALPILAKAYRLNMKDNQLEALYASALINRVNKSTSEVQSGIKLLQDVVKKDPKNKKAYVDMATAYNYFEDYENSFKYVNKALRIDPKYRDAYVIKGGTYYRMGNLKLAKSSYETAVQQDPEFYLGYIQLGWIYTQTEDYTNAKEYFTTALQLNKMSVDAAYGIAYCEQMLNEDEQALHSYRDLLKIDSTYYFAYFNQGYIKQYNQHEIDSAVYYYKKSLALQPEFVKGWHQLGLCYLGQGNKETALIAFNKALEYNPQYELTRKVLKEYYKNYVSQK